MSVGAARRRLVGRAGCSGIMDLTCTTEALTQVWTGWPREQRAGWDSLLGDDGNWVFMRGSDYG